MAVIQLGGGILDARGSIGGQVFSRNRSGNYIRARITPVNPRSARQNVIRAVVQFLAAAWSTVLTQTQRDAWEVYADNIVRQNKLGAQIKLTGFNHYIRSNAPRLQSANPRVDAGPVNLTLPGADVTFAVIVDEATQNITVTFDETLPWAVLDDSFMYISMSLPKTQGTNFIGGPFRLAGSIEGNLALPPTSPATIPVPFPVGENQAVVVQARISEVDGRLSDFFRDQTSVTA